MRYCTIHPHTDVTKFDLFKYSEFISQEIRLEVLRGATEGLDPKYEDHWANLGEFINSLEFHVCKFGHSFIFQKRLDIQGLKYTIDTLLSKYNPGLNVLVYNLVSDVFKSFYATVKKKLLEIEAYELITVLDKKYKRMVKVIKQLLK